MRRNSGRNIVRRASRARFRIIRRGILRVRGHVAIRMIDLVRVRIRSHIRLCIRMCCAARIMIVVVYQYYWYC